MIALLKKLIHKNFLPNEEMLAYDLLSINSSLIVKYLIARRADY